MRLTTLTLTIASLSCAPVWAAKPQIQWDQDYDFGAVETFAWRESPDTSIEGSNPFMHSRIVASVAYQLTTRGLTEVDTDESPDVLVTYHTSTEDRVRLQSSSVGYGFGGYGLGGWGYYGYGMGGPGLSTTTTNVVEYSEDTLVVDIVDVATQTLVFRGTVTEVFSESPQKAEKQMDKAIDKMARRAQKLMDGGS